MFRYFRNSVVAVCLIAAAAALMLMPQPAAAQALYGSITGAVTDQQKAAMPGVTVTATNVGTGLKVETVSDEAGNYTFRNMLPGTYDVSATLEGFKELRRTGYAITAGSVVRVDLAMQLGQLAETVNVIAESTLLQTERADLNTEISSKAVTNLPLNQFRNYQSLLNLVPGATPTQFQNAEIDTPGRSLRTWVNGTQPNANTTRVDGAVSVNVWLPHHAMYIQSAESIDTVNVATNNFDADTGMAAGAAQTVITKSGTNQMRGSAFLFLNTEGMNTNTFFNDVQQPAEAAGGHEDLRRHRRRADHEEQAVLLLLVGALRHRASDDLHLHGADREDARGRLQRGGGGVPDIQAVQPVLRPDGCGARTVDEQHRPGAVSQPDHAVRDDEVLPGGEQHQGPQCEPDS